MIGCMNVDEARAVCKDRSRLRSVVSASPMGKRREFVYEGQNYFFCIIRVLNVIIFALNTSMTSLIFNAVTSTMFEAHVHRHF